MAESVCEMYRNVPSDGNGEAATLSTSSRQHAADTVKVKVTPGRRSLVVSTSTAAAATFTGVARIAVIIIIVVFIFFFHFCLSVCSSWSRLLVLTSDSVLVF